MMKTNHFVELWQELEEQNQQGLVKRAYAEDTRYRIYATMDSPDHICGFAVSFNNTIKVDLKPVKDLRQLSIDLLPDVSYEDSTLLLVQLRNNENWEVFATLCENLISAAMQVAEERLMVKMVMSKLCEWKALFEKLSRGFLTKPQQEGLFGELCLLKKMLLQKSGNPENDIVATWHGMEAERAVRDFQGGHWVVEVKTTATNRPQKVTINGERQLDDSLVDNLFLFHCSVDISNASGVTLPDLVTEVRQLLSHNFIARSLFEEKLYHIGYQNKDVGNYRDRHYLIRTEKFYKVSGDFPRILEHELRLGVGEVHYSIVLDACEQFVVSNTQAFSIINII